MVVTKRRGKWVVDCRIAGRRKVITFSSKAEAETYKREFSLSKVHSSLGQVRIKPTKLKRAIQQYFELVSSKKNTHTQKCEKTYFEKLFLMIGNVEVSNIDLECLERFQDKLSKELMGSTVNRHFNCYRHFFRKCLDWSFIAFDPSARLPNLKEARSEKKVWEDSEIQIFLDNSPKWLSGAIYVLALTGIRAGELCRLKWSDICLEDGAITIYSYKGSGKENKRITPIAKEVVRFLRLKNTASTKLSGSNVFLNATGKPIVSNRLCKATGRLINKLGLTGLTLHGLRHTFITRLAASNHNLEKIRLLAGHTNLKTTQRYLHVNTDSLRGVVDSFSEDKKFKILKSGH